VEVSNMPVYPHTHYTLPLTKTNTIQLILITGYPSSGKTHRSTQLTAYFTQQLTTSPSCPITKIHHITDQTLHLPRSSYASARREKDARATLTSAIKRHLDPSTLVIADSLNYIKGLRYQLYCDAKAARTPSCVVHVGTPAAKCRELNSLALAAGREDEEGGYEAEVFENLIFRYEEPNGMNRWDAPLFTVPFEDAEPPCAEIWAAMVGSGGKKAVAVRPNAATVLKPAAEQGYLYELDKTTSEVVAAIVAWQRDHAGEGGGEVVVGGSEKTVVLPMSAPSLPQLQRLRRQFVGLNRLHSLSKSRVRELFVDYLNDTFQT